MRILRVHNRYQQRGGEDAVFEAECELLVNHGHNVKTLEFTNHDIQGNAGIIDAAKLAANTVWSRSARKRIALTMDDFHPEVVHFDNFFPLVSPAAYSTVRKRRVAVVQTLHNFRLLCPSATLFLDGDIYEKNLGKLVPLPAILDGAYRDSRTQTAVVAAMLTTHRLLRTWHRNVDSFIALTEFGRQKFIDGGLNAERIVVKPNFVNSPVPSSGEGRAGFLFVGRLSSEKGIETLVSAQGHHHQSIRVVGDGPLSGVVEAYASDVATLESLGRLPSSEVHAEMEHSLALVFPSLWYEGFPVTLVEAFASSLPVIASRLGSMAELVDHGETGLLFEAGDANDLAAKITWAAEHPDEMRCMGENARRVYEAKYTPERNYELLMDTYEQAIIHAHM